MTAVDDVTLRVERGEVYGILGANGGGKSTLIRLVSTLLTLDQGRVEILDSRRQPSHHALAVAQRADVMDEAMRLTIKHNLMLDFTRHARLQDPA